MNSGLMRNSFFVKLITLWKRVYQSQLDFGGGKLYLLRVIVSTDPDPPIVVTIYRTSKVEKYWSKP